MKEIRKKRNQYIMRLSTIFMLLIVLPFCLAIIFPNIFILILAMVLFIVGLIFAMALLYRVDDLNRTLRKWEQING